MTVLWKYHVIDLDDLKDTATAKATEADIVKGVMERAESQYNKPFTMVMWEDRPRENKRAYYFVEKTFAGLELTKKRAREYQRQEGVTAYFLPEFDPSS